MRAQVSTRWTQAGSAALLLLVGLATAGCSRILNGPASAHDVVVRPTEIMDFHVLYSENCSACHGAEGKNGPSVALNNPLYLAVVSDAQMVNYTTNGGPGGQMPAFGRSAGGLLTSDQINAIVKGIRQKWAKPAMFTGMTLPPYAADHPGDVAAGGQVYAQACANCHGAALRNGAVPTPGKAGSLVSADYLSLISDQGLRTVVLAGRTDLGMPDYRNDIPGRPLTDADITNVVAWLSAHRPPSVSENADGNQGPGQQAPAVKAEASKATNMMQGAAQRPSASDQGRISAQSKAKQAKKTAKDNGMIRQEGR
jgi:cytochrome c oxidase cbb3-type subunit 3